MKLLLVINGCPKLNGLRDQPFFCLKRQLRAMHSYSDHTIEDREAMEDEYSTADGLWKDGATVDC